MLALGSLLLRVTGVGGVFAALGAFLFDAFSWAGFFVPAYLAAGAILLVAPGFRRRSVFLLMLSTVPFLTLSLGLHVLTRTNAALPLLLVDSFGVLPAALILFFLLALEVIVILTLPTGKTAAAPDPRRAPLALPAGERLDTILDPRSGLAARIDPDLDLLDELPQGDSGSSVESLPVIAEDPTRADDVALSLSSPPSTPPSSALTTDDEPVVGASASAPARPALAADDETAGRLSASSPLRSALTADDEPANGDTVDDAAEVEPVDDALAAPGSPAGVAAAAAGAAATARTAATAAKTDAATAPASTTAKPDVATIPGPAPDQVELPFPATGSAPRAYGIPVKDVLKNRGGNEYWVIDGETKSAAKVLTDALAEFNIDAEVTGIRKGPVITLFEVLPAPGVRVSKIANLADNIALRLAAPSVRIVAPIPGRHAVGIEVPNKVRSIVSFKEMISLDQMQKSSYEIPIALGKDILGEAQIIDLVQTPHLLIGGATNSGKSVLVNSIICSILFRRSPDEVRMFLIDPKIVELKLYNGCPHLLTPVITEPKKAFQALQYCISEMERRYTLLDALGVRDIRSFNKKAKKERVQRLPYIVIVVDEFADLMATTGKELESTLARLAAMARAVGIHMVLATQRPSIDVITGLIKANIPSRIAFMVANKFDSRIIIDAVGAEKLLGKGDMLFSAAWNPFPVRIQGAYIDDEETDAVTEHLKKLGPPQYIDDEVFFDDDETGDFEGEPGNDPLYDRALEVVMAQGKASASYIQRRLKIGYNRAARLVEEMEERGIVGPAQGSKPREILHFTKP
ncbi:MAG TPA: DNA translocase FtsK [Spirochaetia bacterium]